MITDDMTMAMARMWTDWTMGMIHCTDWKVMLIGVWDSQSQNWATWASIALSRTLSRAPGKQALMILNTPRAGGPLKKMPAAGKCGRLLAMAT
jgi:hypothetical protein